MIDPLVVVKVNRVALICRDQEAIARNAAAVRKAAREYIDDGSDRSVLKIRKRKKKR